MNKTKIDNYYKSEINSFRIDDVKYIIIPNSDIKPLLDKLQQENNKLKQINEEHRVLNGKLREENKQLKEELKSKPDTEITLQDDKGKKYMLVQTERIDIEENLGKTIQRLFNNWNKLKEIAKSQSGFKKRADLKGGLWFEVDDLLDKMQEIEQGSDK